MRQPQTGYTRYTQTEGPNRVSEPVNATDEQLLARLARGDSSAFEALFLRYYGLVYRVLYGLVESREEAEDLAQETFLTLYHKPPGHAGLNGGMAAWLSRVALNRGYNALRSARRTRQRLENLELPAATDELYDPYALVARAEERAQVRVLLAQLPERQSKLLLLRYAGLSYAEIAATLELAPGSVGTLLVRAERRFLAAHRQMLDTAGVSCPQTERGTS